MHTGELWGCGGESQIFWGCPKIQKFWENIWEIAQQILGLLIPLTCVLLYLGDLPEEITGNYLLKIFTAAAKKSNHS